MFIIFAQKKSGQCNNKKSSRPTRIDVPRGLIRLSSVLVRHRQSLLFSQPGLIELATPSAVRDSDSIIYCRDFLLATASNRFEVYKWQTKWWTSSPKVFQLGQWMRAHICRTFQICSLHFALINGFHYIGDLLAFAKRLNMLNELRGGKNGGKSRKCISYERNPWQTNGEWLILSGTIFSIKLN